ncbi:ROK family protein [Azospirillum halopraeferens]|uniref:ROK family protein n=1 Tax=Azospirillum halopraeferens TaxID=34010 RepID=UPI000420BF5A|nr:ROK family protein [Azospirillum halopraeferens]
MRIGVDLGGTKIEAVAMDALDHERLRRRVPTPRGDYAATLAAVAALVDGIEETLGERGTVGVGMPGSISPATGLVKGCNSTWLVGHPIRRDLEAALGRPVRCANDANCLAVSEAMDGAAAGAGVVFAVVLGTGCGGGLALAGVMHEGPNGVAGEWGHNALPRCDGDAMVPRPCFCGRHDCIETYLCGPAFEAEYVAAAGRALPAAAIARQAAAGDPLADAVLTRYEERLARALAHAVNLLDPDVIVLGGGLSNIDRLYRTVPPRMAQWVFGGECRTPVRRARHGDASGVRGAARLWPP